MMKFQILNKTTMKKKFKTLQHEKKNSTKHTAITLNDSKTTHTKNM